MCDTGFTLIGRDDDLVKICGKRHSLAALNALLAATPGVIEASYYFPGATENQSETARPVAFVVLAAEATLQTVLHQLRGRLDDVFLPRPLYQVDILPRSETGKLARPDLTDLYIRCKQRASSGHVTRPDPPRLHEAAPRKIAMDDAPMDASPTPDAGLNQVPLEGRSPC
jgi:acyl-coenzyme A synthetase/AMP-(fatty) acid ligase